MLKKILQDGAIFKSDWSVIELYGEDAQSFVQNQTSNDVNKLLEDNFHWNTLLDISGKVVSYFILLRKSSHEFYLLLPSNLVEQTIERLEKYLIAEDVEISRSDKTCFIAIGYASYKVDGFKGTFLNLPSVISFQAYEECNKTLLEDYWFIQGDPKNDFKEVIGVLVNNTFLEELAVSYKKGCFLGQETVSKIHSRRGAAFKFVILEIENEFSISFENIISDNKKIGKVFSSHIIEGNTFLRAQINRENRLENKTIKIQNNENTILAKVHYAPFLKLSIEDVAVDLYDEAIVDFQNDDEEQAILKLQKCIKLYPTFEDAYESLGVIYGRQEKFEKAIELMQRLSRLNTSSVMAHTNMSLYYMRLGNIELAEEHKSLATVKSFEQFGKIAETKNIQEKLKQKELEELNQRESMFKQVLEIDEEDALANFGMGDIELSRKNYFVSIQYLEKAICADPKYSVAYLALSKAFKESSQNEKAFEILKKGIEVATKNGDLMPANEMQSILNELELNH